MKEIQRPTIINPADFESFTDLGEREKNAVWVALDGIAKKSVGEDVKLMRVKSSPVNNFDFWAFQVAMSDLGIYVSYALEENGEEQIYTFDVISIHEPGK